VSAADERLTILALRAELVRAYRSRNAADERAARAEAQRDAILRALHSTPTGQTRAIAVMYVTVGMNSHNHQKGE
jgi:hypothetical protein